MLPQLIISCHELYVHYLPLDLHTRVRTTNYTILLRPILVLELEPQQAQHTCSNAPRHAFEWSNEPRHAYTLIYGIEVAGEMCVDGMNASSDT